MNIVKGFEREFWKRIEGEENEDCSGELVGMCAELVSRYPRRARTFWSFRCRKLLSCGRRGAWHLRREEDRRRVQCSYSCCSST